MTCAPCLAGSIAAGAERLAARRAVGHVARGRRTANQQPGRRKNRARRHACAHAPRHPTVCGAARVFRRPTYASSLYHYLKKHFIGREDYANCVVIHNKTVSTDEK
jgi:hypothetical protein